MTPVLNNAVFMKDDVISASSFIGEAHLHNLAKQSPDDLGLWDFWAQRCKAESPIYNLSRLGGQKPITVYNDEGKYTWKAPLFTELPFIMEDLDPTNTQKGIDGTPFKIKLNKRAFGNTEVITYDKFQGLELRVTQDEIIPTGDGGYIYTVKLKQGEGVFLDNKYLQPGTKYISLFTASDSYTEKRASSQSEVGYREFFNYVGNAWANGDYEVERDAALALKAGIKTKDAVPVKMLFSVSRNILDPSVVDYAGLERQFGGAKGLSKAIENGVIGYNLVESVAADKLNKISKDIENSMLWGKGGTFEGDGPADIRTSVGLWKQLDNGNKYIYNLSSFSLAMFQENIYNFFNGKEDWEGPNKEREIEVQTGLAGMALFNEAVMKEASNQGWLTVEGSNSGIGAITGSGMNLGYGYGFTSYIIPNVARIHFVLNPALDNVNGLNEIECPLIANRPLSSYSFLIFDIDEQEKGNIVQLKSYKDPGLIWWYENGNMPFQGSSQGFQGRNFNGFRVHMEQMIPSIVVKDPTRCLKMVMKHPKTGYVM